MPAKYKSTIVDLAMEFFHKQLTEFRVVLGNALKINQGVASRDPMSVIETGLERHLAKLSGDYLPHTMKAACRAAADNKTFSSKRGMFCLLC